jgi:hypothetical protein
MAHYAFLNMQNIVTEVIAGKDETDGPTNWEIHYGNIKEQVCKRTSYNTLSNQHSNGGTPFRKNYAEIGSTYDFNRDAFIPAKLYDSWTLNEDTCQWQPPTVKPDGEHSWNEAEQAWEQMNTL